MSLEYAILGFLQTTPLSGYDLKKVFDKSAKHFWSADQSQIYRTLARLTSDEMVSMETVIQDNRPNSKVYQITGKGKEEFNRWLASPISQVEPRVSWLIQLFFAGGLSDEDIIHLLEQLASQIRSAIIDYNHLLNVEHLNLFQQSARDLFFHKLTLDYVIMINQSVLSWLKKTIDRIKNREYKDGE